MLHIRTGHMAFSYVRVWAHINTCMRYYNRTFLLHLLWNSCMWFIWLCVFFYFELFFCSSVLCVCGYVEAKQPSIEIRIHTIQQSFGAADIIKRAANCYSQMERRPYLNTHIFAHKRRHSDTQAVSNSNQITRTGTQSTRYICFYNTSVNWMNLYIYFIYYCVN